MAKEAPARPGPYSRIDAGRRGTRFPGTPYERLLNQGRYGLFRGQETLQQQFPGAYAGVQQAIADPSKVKAGGARFGAGLAGVEEILSGNVLGGALGLGAGLGTAGLVNKASEALLSPLARAPGPLKYVGLAGKYLLPYMAGEAVTRGVAGAVQGTPAAVAEAGSQVTAATPGVMGGLTGIGGLLQDVPLIGQGYQTRRRGALRREEQEKDELLRQRLAAGERREQEAMESRMLERERAAASSLNQEMARLGMEANRQAAIQQQALLNTQGNIYQNITRTAGGIQLAGIGMQESGALARTLAQTNPYAGAVIQAPQITFGR